MKWSWSGAVALVLAVCIGVGFGTTLIIVALDPAPMTEAGAALLYGATGTLIGGVIGWLNRHKGDNDDE